MGTATNVSRVEALSTGISSQTTTGSCSPTKSQTTRQQSCLSQSPSSPLCQRSNCSNPLRWRGKPSYPASCLQNLPKESARQKGAELQKCNQQPEFLFHQRKTSSSTASSRERKL